VTLGGRSVDDLVVARIERHGPLSFAEVMDVALYHPDHGFYATGGSAGRRGDFLTSPEVGPLFGTVLARALDAWWDGLGRPDPFVVVEAGAGVGTLSRGVASARPRCEPALTYVLAEQSAALRDAHDEHLPLTVPEQALPPSPAGDDDHVGSLGRGPRFVSLADLPAVTINGVVVVNELLDNLPFHLLERASDGWLEVRVGLTGGTPPVGETLVPAADDLAELAERFAPDAPLGGRLPIQAAAAAWLGRALRLVARGRVVVFDYATTTPSIVVRPVHEWVRTYRGHQRGGPPLESLGQQDITCEVCTDQLARVRRPAVDRTQAEFLVAFGLVELVEEGRRVWHERAHIGDLEALRGRSRVREAEALTDPGGLGAFRALEWEVG
jgi:SAM-dependent MidA family methyltransferase